MPLFDPDTDLGFGEELDFDLYTPVEGYASAECLGVGLSVDAVPLPLRLVSQLEHTSAQSTPLGSPRSAPQDNPAATNTHPPSQSPASKSNLPSTASNMDQDPNNNMQPYTRHPQSGTGRHETNGEFVEDETLFANIDRNTFPPASPSRHPGDARLAESDSRLRGYGAEDGDDDDESEYEPPHPRQRANARQTAPTIKSAADEEEEEDEQHGHEASQEEHKSRWEPDFGKLRPKIPESILSFIRDGYVVLRNVEVVCFKPEGGAWKASNNQRGSGQVWISNEEETFKDALLWALGRGRVPRPPAFLPQYRDSYMDARLERSEELARMLDSGRYKGKMNAPQMAINRQTRLSNVLQLLPNNRSVDATPAQAQAMVNAIAGKYVDFAQLKSRIEDTNTHGFGPLPLAMQVDPVYLPPGRKTDKLIVSKTEEYDDWKKAADKARREKGKKKD